MKNLTILFLLFFSLLANSQVIFNTGDSISNAESFSIRKGTLIEIEYIDIAHINKALVQAVNYTDLISKEKEQGVRIEYLYKSQYTSDTKIAVLDIDETKSLINSFKIISEVIKEQRQNYTEIKYVSKGGFKAGAYYTVKRNRWTIFIKIEEFDSKSFVYIDATELNDVILVFNKALEALESK